MKTKQDYLDQIDDLIRDTKAFQNCINYETVKVMVDILVKTKAAEIRPDDFTIIKFVNAVCAVQSCTEGIVRSRQILSLILQLSLTGSTRHFAIFNKD